MPLCRLDDGFELILVDEGPGRGSDKFYRILRIGGRLEIHFGRRGSKGQFQQRDCGTPLQATWQLAELLHQKQNKGYWELFSLEGPGRFDPDFQSAHDCFEEMWADHLCGTRHSSPVRWWVLGAGLHEAARRDRIAMLRLRRLCEGLHVSDQGRDLVLGVLTSERQSTSVTDYLLESTLQWVAPVGDGDGPAEAQMLLSLVGDRPDLHQITEDGPLLLDAARRLARIS